MHVYTMTDDLQLHLASYTVHIDRLCVTETTLTTEKHSHNIHHTDVPFPSVYLIPYTQILIHNMCHFDV